MYQPVSENFEGVTFLLKAFSIEHEVSPFVLGKNRIVRFKKDGVWWVVEQYKETIDIDYLGESWISSYGLAFYEEGKRPKLMTKVSKDPSDGHFPHMIVVSYRKA